MPKKTESLNYQDSWLFLNWKDDDNAAFRITDGSGELCSGTLEVTRFPDGSTSAQLRTEKMPSALTERTKFQKAQQRMSAFAALLKYGCEAESSEKLN